MAPMRKPLPPGERPPSLRLETPPPWPLGRKPSAPARLYWDTITLELGGAWSPGDLLQVARCAQMHARAIRPDASPAQATALARAEDSLGISPRGRRQLGYDTPAPRTGPQLRERPRGTTRETRSGNTLAALLDDDQKDTA